jgi:50S ribosomal protein L16 3-hydroxylase
VTAHQPEFVLPPDFYSRYWQREPLVIRSAIANFSSPLTPDDLAGLACMDGIEARIVLEKSCAIRWEVRHGPFAEELFGSLPESHWSLLVQAVDHWDVDVAALRRLFPMIPNWRIDDVMVSYAADGGSVGPHYDNYDVFLLQGLVGFEYQQRIALTYQPLC